MPDPGRTKNESGRPSPIPAPKPDGAAGPNPAFDKTGKGLRRPGLGPCGLGQASRPRQGKNREGAWRKRMPFPRRNDPGTGSARGAAPGRNAWPGRSPMRNPGGRAAKPGLSRDTVTKGQAQGRNRVAQTDGMPDGATRPRPRRTKKPEPAARPNSAKGRTATLPNRAERLRPKVSRRTCQPGAPLLFLGRAQRPS